VIKPILPGATLGVLGSGQLGRMFTLAAARMGYHVHVYSPGRQTPAGEVATQEHSAPYEDTQALTAFARQVEVVTFEFENVPSSVCEVIEKYARVAPSGNVFHICQNRLREKSTLRGSGLPVPDFLAVRSLQELQAGLKIIGCPAVIKTSSSGYDGKGQAVIRSAEDLTSAWDSLSTDEAILEQLVDFDSEISVIGARNPQGDVAFFRPFHNTHRSHILDITLCPAALPQSVEDNAIEISRHVLEQLNVTGVLCVELFVKRDGSLLINELAPRPHNSGHLTIDAHSTCQFEQQVRAICGLPLGSVRQLSAAAMANVLGDLWQPAVPDWSALAADGEARLHLYGKKNPGMGRKMGHITALGPTTSAARELVLAARDRLQNHNP